MMFFFFLKKLFLKLAYQKKSENIFYLKKIQNLKRCV
jgi:hypothetical protein